MRPVISIIIPVLNEAGAIAGLLGQLRSMHNRGHEIIVVDGRSSDDTVSCASAGADKVIVAGPGRAAQMNAGAQQATGDVFWFLHVDSRIDEDSDRWILEQIGGGSCWGWHKVRLSGNRWIYRIVEQMMNFRSRATSIATGDQGMFVTRELFQTAGGFPSIELMEDIALSRQLKRLSKPAIIENPLVTSSRRWESRGPLRTIVSMWLLRAAYALGANPRRLARLYYGD